VRRERELSALGAARLRRLSVDRLPRIARCQPRLTAAPPDR
jgi:hypothetical protein